MKKGFLNREAKKEGVSASQFVRQRCEGKPQNPEDEEMLAALKYNRVSATVLPVVDTQFKAVYVV